ncbi:alpha/beta-hydrolase [Trametopsis cervina]|nr:alpha/beta-hydrolase [Trametopsis cervina]
MGTNSDKASLTVDPEQSLTIPPEHEHEAVRLTYYQHLQLAAVTVIVLTMLIATVLLTFPYVFATVGGALRVTSSYHQSWSGATASFYSKVESHNDDTLCPGMYAKTRAISHSGYIGLQGDTLEQPKKSFFWFFEAQDANSDAPLILSIGGGPGVTALLNPLLGQSHCMLTPNGTTKSSPYAWTEHFNLVAVDHPVNVGLSFGTPVSNSRDAAYDVYDFLQKFYTIFPHLRKNSLILSGGSYAGTYIPHIATVIHKGNLAIASVPGHATAHRINLESMMLSNPHTDALSHYTWTLQQRCKYTDLYNSTVCDSLYERLPFCLDAIQLVYEDPSILDHRVRANTICQTTQLQKLEGRSYDNVNLRCNGTLDDCLPQGVWLSQFINTPKIKQTLGVPAGLGYSLVNQSVHKAFIDAGDIVQPAHWMYPPLLKAGIRLLHYVGKLDANCPWPGTLSMLNLLRSPVQAAFSNAPDLPWTGENATVRAVGEGAGDLTYIFMEDSGHMVLRDQPALVKRIVDHWIVNEPFDTVTNSP